MSFAIFDWSGNEIQRVHNGFWCPMHFDTFNDAWEYLFATYPNDDDLQEYEVREL